MEIFLPANDDSFIRPEIFPNLLPLIARHFKTLRQVAYHSTLSLAKFDKQNDKTISSKFLMAVFFGYKTEDFLRK
jgi:hypothetical protein